MRQGVVSGKFYSSNFSDLDKEINDCFISKFGPGDLPTTKRDNDIIGIISPHAGYMYSGPCAAWSFKEIAENKFPDVFIMLGLSHNGFPSCVSIEDWQTPFGTVESDKNFLKELDIPINEEAHAFEHSIEVQLPFLQFVNKDRLNDIKIAPIIVNKDCEKVAELIFDAIKKTKKKVMIIASSDFTHYGASYGYTPFQDNIKENIYNLDKGAIDAINALDSTKFLNYINKTRATICGKYPISCLIELSKKLGAKKASLLNYYTSGDISGDYANSVGYAGIKIK